MTVVQLIYFLVAVFFAIAIPIYLHERKKNKKTNPESENITGDEREFVLLWCKKMVNENKIHYTTIFKTKVKAKTRKEAFDKVTDIAMRKMQLLIVEEKDFDKSELGRIQKKFDDANKKMDEAFSVFDKF